MLLFLDAAKIGKLMKLTNKKITINPDYQNQKSYSC